MTRTSISSPEQVTTRTCGSSLTAADAEGEAVTQSSTRTKRALKRFTTVLKSHYLPLLLGLATVFGYLFPNVARSPGGSIQAQYSVLYGAVAATFLTSGLSLPTNQLARQVKNWRLHIIVQGFSFLVVPAIVRAIVQIIIASGAVMRDGRLGGNIDPAVLAGILVTSAIPTTIASNVVMTREATGDQSAAIIEVLLGNILGPFITPGWIDVLIPDTALFEAVRAARVGGNSSTPGLQAMYVKVFKYLALAVYLPLAVGQVVRWFWPGGTSLVMSKYKLGKIGMVAMILLVWTTMSTCFYENAFNTVSKASIILVCFLNVGLYITFSILSFVVSNPPAIVTRTVEFHLPYLRSCCLNNQGKSEIIGKPERTHFLVSPLRPLPPAETIAVCFCGPAKTTALGIPLLYAMWSDATPEAAAIRARMSIPVVLYTTEQILFAHFFVGILRAWRRRKEARNCDVVADRVQRENAEGCGFSVPESTVSRDEEKGDGKQAIDSGDGLSRFFGQEAKAGGSHSSQEQAQ